MPPSKPTTSMDPVEHYRALEARVKRAEEDAKKAEQDLAVAEDRLKSAKAAALRDLGSDDPEVLDAEAKTLTDQASAALAEIETTLEAKGY